MLTDINKIFINFSYFWDGDRVASAAVFGQQVYSVRLPSASSIFSAEANAMLLALKFVASSDKSKFMICSDSRSCLLAIESCQAYPFILKIAKIYKNLVDIGKHVICTWIPSHKGIHGNTVVDQGQMVIEQNRPAVRKQLPMLLYHHPLIHQYILQSIQMLRI
jgi:ribonuclease HI